MLSAVPSFPALVIVAETSCVAGCVCPAWAWLEARLAACATVPSCRDGDALRPIWLHVALASDSNMEKKEAGISKAGAALDATCGAVVAKVSLKEIFSGLIFASV